MITDPPEHPEGPTAVGFRKAPRSIRRVAVGGERSAPGQGGRTLAEVRGGQALRPSGRSGGPVPNPVREVQAVSETLKEERPV